MPEHLRKRLALLLTLFLLVGLTGCGGGDGVAINGKLLTWLGDGTTPTDRPGGATTVAYMTSNGATETLVDVSSGATGVVPCGNEPASRDGKYFTFFVNIPQAGVDSGTLYQVSGADKPAAIGDAHALACLGNGSFQYAPDGGRLGYIDYRGFRETAEYATGTLRIFKSDSLEAQNSFEQVTAFQLSNTDAVFVSFFTSGGSQAREAGVYIWDGVLNSSATEISTLYAGQGCRLTSAAITATTEQRLAVVIGQRCGGNTEWQFYTINRTNGVTNRIAEGTLNTQYYTSARTNNLFASANTSTLFFTLPDALVRNTVRIAAITADDVTTDNIVVERAALMPRYAARTFMLAREVGPIFSRDGKWLALAVANANLTPVVTVLNLVNPSDPPITITAGERGQGIPFMAFAPDSSRLYYLVGGGDGEENALFVLDMQTTTERRILRGRFGGGVVSPDGKSIALMQWKQTEEARPRTYVDLVIVPGDGENPEAKTLYSGLITGEGGAVAGRRWAYPLTWR